MKKLSLFIFLIFFSILMPTMAQDWGNDPQYLFNYRGNWSNTLTYNSNDAVRGSNGVLYVAVENNVPVGTNPVGSTRYWAEGVSNRGVPGATGPEGNSIDVIFINSGTTPTLPAGATYSNGTFSNIGSWSNTVPSGNSIYMGVYIIDSQDRFISTDLVQLSGRQGIRGPTGSTGEKGDSVGFIYIRQSGAAPSLPGDNTGTRTGSRITTPPLNWHLTRESTSGNAPLYMAVAILPGGNLTIDYQTLIYLHGEQGIRGPIGNTGVKGDTGTSLAFAFQRKTGSAPSLPADNTGSRSGAVLSSAPSGWNLNDPGGNDPLYMAVAILPGDNVNEIDWKTVSKQTGERGQTGNDGTNGIDGVDGWSQSSIYRKVNTYDYSTTPSVTYDGNRPADETSLTLPSQWSLLPYVSQSFGTWNLSTTAPQDFAYDVDTNLVYTLGTNSVYKNGLGGNSPPANSSWSLRSNNNSPRSISVLGDNVYVLDDQQRSSNNNYFYRIFVYLKDQGGYLRTITIPTPQTDPPPVKIAAYGNRIFVVSNKNRNNQGTSKAIRLFTTAGIEVTSEGRDLLPSEITNVVGLAANNVFLHLLDGTDDRVYTLDRVDLGRRITSREFDINSNNDDPLGLALSEFELHIIETTNNTVYRYYNPNNRLWQSGLVIQEESPYAVRTTDPFQASVRRENNIGTVVETGGGGTGSGDPGDSVRLIFREIAIGATAPTTPPSNQGTLRNGVLTTAPNDWHLTASGAQVAFGPDGVLYGSIVNYKAGADSIGSYGTPFEMSGPQGVAGDSVSINYSPDNSVWSTTGRDGDDYIRFRIGNGAWTPGFKFTGSDGDSVSIEFSVDGQGAWETRLDATDDYFMRFRVGTGPWSDAVQFRAYPLQIQFSANAGGPWANVFSDYIRISADNGVTWISGRITGEDGDDSLEIQYSADNVTFHNALADGDFYIRFRIGGTGPWSIGRRFVQTLPIDRTLYQRSSTPLTVTPSSLEYDYATGNYSNLAGWLAAVPTGSDTLYRLNIRIPIQSTTSIVTPSIQGAIYTEQGEPGQDGTDGTDGNDGADGQSIRVLPVYQWSVSTPNDPPSGISYNVNNGTIDGLGPWREAETETGSAGESLWMAEIEIVGSTATFRGKYRLPPGNKGNDGNSVDVIYRRSATVPPAPTGGTFNGSDFDPPPNWHESDPGGANDLYIVLVTLSGTDKTNSGISYGTVNKINGERGASIDFFFQRTTTNVAPALPGRITYNGLHWGNYDPWVPNNPAGSGAYLWMFGAYYQLGVNDTSPTTIRPWLATPPPLMIQFSVDGSTLWAATGVTNPYFIRFSVDNGDTWSAAVRIRQDGSDGTNAPNVQIQYSVDNTTFANSVTNPYFIRFSVDGGTTWSAGQRFRMDGNQGIQGIQGIQGETGHQGGFSRSLYQRSASAPTVLPINLQYDWDTNNYTNKAGWNEGVPSGTNTLYKIDIIVPARGASSTVRATVDGSAYTDQGERGQPGINGTAAPIVQIQYSIDGTTYASSVINPYFIRFSVDGGTTWSAGHRFRQDGSDGTGSNGFSYQNYYHANIANSVGTPNVDYDGTNFSGITAGWTTTVPTAPVGANIFKVPVRYMIGTAGETVEGVILEGTVPGSVTPPPVSRNSYTMSYGLATAGPGFTISDTSQTNAIQLGSGESGYFDFVTPTNTNASPNWYFDLPTGLTLVNVQQRQGGQYLTTNNWTTDDSSNPRRYINDSPRIGYTGIVRVNVRRP